ncbi:MAG: dihydroneopterin aldolase [Thermoleophilia bacterium]
MDYRAMPATIHIEGLEVQARHGLLPAEKAADQLFRFDLELRLGSCPACMNDNIEDTVDYAAVCDDVVAAATAVSHELLEKLAAQVANVLMQKYPLVEAVRVRVEKARPPLEHATSGVAVTVELER